MKIYILSDVHLEFADFRPPEIDVDVVILAGDIHVGNEGLKWAHKHFNNIPVIYVLGNHEFYGASFNDSLSSIRELSNNTNIHILENDSIEINDIQFIGCTLWTDFKLHGNTKSAKSMATRYISDYDEINYGKHHRRIKTSDITRLHQYSVSWLKNKIKYKTSEKRVVVTHHAPSKNSLTEEFLKSAISPAYASNLDALVRDSNASLWVHGHTHIQRDYKIGNTRVVSNPRGYPDDSNKNFIPNLIIDI